MKKFMVGLVLLVLVSACNRQEQRTTLPFENNPGV
jgi:hypothetical protein